MATVILRVESPVSSTGSIIVVLPLVRSSSALLPSENNIYISTILTLYFVETVECRGPNAMKLQGLRISQT